MSKILKNNTLSDILISDVGVSIPSGSQITIESTDALLWAGSDDIVEYIGSGDIIVNDGTSDQSKSNGIKLIQGLFRTDTVGEIKPTIKHKRDYSELIEILEDIKSELKISNKHSSFITGERIR